MLIDGYSINIINGWWGMMKGKFLILLFIIIGSFLLNLSMFVGAKVLYNIENNNDVLTINFLDYFNCGFVERLKMIAMHSFIFFVAVLFFYKK